jgi:LemA protein
MQKLGKKKIYIILLALLAVLLLWGIITRNSLIAKDEKVTSTWNNLYVSYQRRFDLIPQLNAVVKASSDFEKSTLVQLTEIRAQKGGIVADETSSSNYNKLESNQADYANTFNKVLAVVERYPDIKSQQNYIRFQDQIAGTERRIKFSRKEFNDAVLNYNTSVRSFPSSLVASLFGFKVKDGFVADTGADKAPEIKFNK